MIRRPIVLLLVAYVTGCLLYQIPIFGILMLTVGLYSVMAFFYFQFSNSRHDLIIFIMPVFLLLGIWSTGNQRKVPVVEQSTRTTMTGTVDQILPTANSNKILLKRNVKGTEEKLVLYIKDVEGLKIGQRILVKGTVEPLTKATNKGQFDEQQYYQSQNISYKVFGDSYTILNTDHSIIKQSLYQIRCRLRNVYCRCVSKDKAGILCAMVLGEKGLLDEDIKELYQACGIAHILAISGLHITLLGMALYKTLERLHMGLRMRTMVTISFIFLYGILTNFSVSTNRAIVMLLIALMARVVGKTFDLLSATALSALIILWQQPGQLYESGFLLSFGAILAIGLVVPVFSQVFLSNRIEHPRLRHKIRYYVEESLLGSLAINLFTLPILLFCFYEFSPYSVLLNIIVIPLMSFVIGLAILGGLIGMIHMGTASIVLQGAGIILNLYQFLCENTRKLPWAIVISGIPDGFRTVCYYGILVFLLLLMKKYGRKIAIGYLLALVLLILPSHFDGLQLTAIDVGQGDSIFLREENGKVVLIDGGSTSVGQVGKYRMIPFLKASGVQNIDAVIVTHSDEDHICGITEVLQQMPYGGINVKHLFMPEIEKEYQNEAYIALWNLAKKKHIPVQFLTSGMKLKVSSCEFTCLFPYDGLVPKDNNSYSTVMSLNYHNKSLLFTGDLGSQGEEWLLSQRVLRRYDVLKVAHHGSKYSSCDAFLDQVSPTYAIISAGVGNRYGHPHKETLQRLKKHQTNIRNTAKEGAIDLYIN